nr:MAG TPA: hypothetical protein [Crassvirales sp.]
MKNFVKKMIEQHANIVVMLSNYNKFMHNAINNDDVNKVTVANVALVVRDLKNLSKDFETCLANEGVEFAIDGTYFEKVTNVTEVLNKKVETKKEDE